MRRLQFSKVILTIELLLSASLAHGATVGNITEYNGNAAVTREGLSIPTKLGSDVNFMDALETAKGRMKVKFSDDTKLSLTEHSEVIIDEYYFDPDPSKSKMTISFVQGTARFATGRLGLVPKENIVIKTPTATIGVRGTDFTTTVDEIGRSLVILLPDAECDLDSLCVPSGSITVRTNAGTVSLTEAYQATTVSSRDTMPTRPVVLQDMNMNMINNMFIVSPPKEIEKALEEEDTSINASTGLLDYNELDTDYLEEDWGENEDDLEYNELDIDYLAGDFLQDLLLDITQLDYLAEKTDGLNIVGTTLGYNSETQYSTIVENDTIWFYRFVDGIISIRLSVDSNARIESENNGKKNLIAIGDGQSVVISIKQSSG